MGSTPSKEFPAKFALMQKSLSTQIAKNQVQVHSFYIRGRTSCEAQALAKYVNQIEKDYADRCIITHDISSDNSVYNIMCIPKKYNGDCKECGNTEL